MMQMNSLSDGKPTNTIHNNLCVDAAVYLQLQSSRLHPCRLLLKTLWFLCLLGFCRLWRNPSGRIWSQTECICVKYYTTGLVSSNMMDTCLTHLSSSSSMKPLLSASSTVKTFFTSSNGLVFRPTISKNFLWSKESAAVHATCAVM